MADRLPEIKRALWAQWNYDGPPSSYVTLAHVKWLIEEVEQLRAALFDEHEKRIQDVAYYATKLAVASIGDERDG